MCVCRRESGLNTKAPLLFADRLPELRLHSRVGGRHDLLGYGAWMYIDEKGIRWIVGAYAPD